MTFAAGRIRRWLSIAAQALLLLTFVLLVASNFMLRRERDELRAIIRQNGVSRSPLRAGEQLPHFSVRDKSGRVVVFGSPRGAGREEVLVVVDPRCKRCEAALREVATGSHSQVAVISVQSSAMSASVASAVPPDVPLYFVEDRVRARPLLERLSRIPTVIRVAADQKVVSLCGSVSECLAASACNDCDAPH